MTRPTPAGWFPDPENPDQFRYWDGGSWSAETAPGVAGTSPAPYSPYSPGGTTRADRPAVPWWQTWYAIVPGLLFCLPFGLVALWLRTGISPQVKTGVTAAAVVLFGVAMVIPDESDDEATDTAVDPSTSAATPGPETADPAPEPEPDPLIEVPALVGMDLERAQQQLRESGLDLGKVERRPSAEPKGTILEQRIAEGTEVEAGETVALVVAKPYPRVPTVIGGAKDEAVRQLEEAGFRVRTSTEARESGSDGSVLRQRPRGGVRAEPNSVVRLVVLELVEPPPPPAPLVDNCTPGYSPCLPPAEDYDCAGGSGNGPAYAHGPVEVTGSDPYDLDRDGDGIACES